MAYDDDFDEEEVYNSKKTRSKYQVDVVRSRDQDNRAIDIGSDSISDIQPTKAAEFPAGGDLEDDDEDDMLDTMARFVEGHDLEMVKDHSDIF